MRTAIIAIIVIIFAGVNEAGAKRPQVPAGKRSAHVATQAQAGASYAAQDARPAKWCGFFARKHLVSVDPGEKYNLARAWSRWGWPTYPQVGAIVVWSHHVGKITELHGNGTARVLSGNDNGRVRNRDRPITNAIAFRVENAYSRAPARESKLQP